MVKLSAHRHGLNLDLDDEGWCVALCDCGWLSPPCPDNEIAAEFYAQHCVETA